MNKQLGERLKGARDDSGKSRETVTQDLAAQLPPVRITTKTLQRIEAGADVSVWVLSALCRVYNKTISELAPEMLEEAEQFRDLLVLTSCWNTEKGNVQDADLSNAA